MRRQRRTWIWAVRLALAGGALAVTAGQLACVPVHAAAPRPTAPNLAAPVREASTAAGPGVSVTVHSGTVGGRALTAGDTLDPGLGLRQDLQALQTTAVQAPGLSSQQKAALRRQIRQASAEAQTLSAAARPLGAQTRRLTVTASARVVGGAIMITPAAQRCMLRRARRVVGITILRVESDVCTRA